MGFLLVLLSLFADCFRLVLTRIMVRVMGVVPIHAMLLRQLCRSSSVLLWWALF
jgi:hypothetical protein